MGNEYKGVERRKFKRLKISLNVIFRKSEPLEVRIKSADKETQAAVLDISGGGICIVTDLNVPPSTELSIRFTLTRTEESRTSYYGTIEVMGKVCYNIAVGQDTYRLGISFCDVDSKSKGDLDNFLEAIEGEQKNN